MYTLSTLMAQPETTTNDTQNGSKAAKGKGKRSRKQNSVNAISGTDLSDMNATWAVDTNPIGWAQMPTFQPFVPKPSSRFLCVKDSCSSYINLKTGEHKIDVVSGECYRVYI